MRFPFSNCFSLIEEKSGFLNSQLISFTPFPQTVPLMSCELRGLDS